MAHTSRGKDFVEYDNPYNVGMTGMIGGAAGYHAVLDCDVLLLLGADFAWPQFYPNKATILQIDENPTHIGRRHPVEIGAVGDIKTTLQALLPRLQQHEDNAFLARPCSAASEGCGGGESRDRVRLGRHFRHLSDEGHQPARRAGRLVHRRRRDGVWSGRFAISKPAASAGPSAACCMARWRAACLRRSGCKSASRGDRSSAWRATAASPCCSAIC